MRKIVKKNTLPGSNLFIFIQGYSDTIIKILKKRCNLQGLDCDLFS